MPIDVYVSALGGLDCVSGSVAVPRNDGGSPAGLPWALELVFPRHPGRSEFATCPRHTEEVLLGGRRS
jgi:hypothetical protein